MPRQSVWPTVDPDALADNMFAGGSAARNARRNLVNGYLEEITNHGIDEEAWNAMSRAGHNAVNDRLRAAVVDKEGEVVAELRAELG